MGISDSDAVLMNAEKKRQKSLQCNSKISTKRFSALKGAVSAVGDSKRSSAVDDFQDNTCIDTQQSCVYDEHVSTSAPSLVLPLTWHCYMWLHVMCDV